MTMKRNICLLLVTASLLVICAGLTTSLTVAQNLVNCGDPVYSEFNSSEEFHEYTVQLEASSKLWVIGIVDPDDRHDMDINVSVYNSNGAKITEGERFDSVYTQTLIPRNEIYMIRVHRFGTDGGRYTLYISCVGPAGHVISNARYIQNAACGNIVESMIELPTEYHYYYLDLEDGMTIRATGEVSQGDSSDLKISLDLFAPSGARISQIGASTSPEISITVQRMGTHSLLLSGFGTLGSSYTLYIQCIRADGSIIRPGDVPFEGTFSDPQPRELESSFSGFGLPSMPAVDFANGIQISLPLGQPQVVPLGSEIVVYMYEAETNETRRLRVSKLSGDISAGIAVLNQDTNNTVFSAGLRSSNNLIVDLTFPEEGMYAIGLYRIDSGSTGAIELTLE